MYLFVSAPTHERSTTCKACGASCVRMETTGEGPKTKGFRGKQEAAVHQACSQPECHEGRTGSSNANNSQRLERHVAADDKGLSQEA